MIEGGVGPAELELHQGQDLVSALGERVGLPLDAGQLAPCAAGLRAG
jgi:hypothetical protein